jgi:hypothetical protein
MIKLCTFYSGRLKTSIMIVLSKTRLADTVLITHLSITCNEHRSYPRIHSPNGCLSKIPDFLIYFGVNRASFMMGLSHMKSKSTPSVLIVPVNPLIVLVPWRDCTVRKQIFVMSKDSKKSSSTVLVFETC